MADRQPDDRYERLGSYTKLSWDFRGEIGDEKHVDYSNGYCAIGDDAARRRFVRDGREIGQ